MASIEKRNGVYRVRYRDPVGSNRSRTFRRKVDADRFSREVEVDKDRGSWVDPRKADTPLAEWAETFMSLARSLAPTTEKTYRRDLDRYVLPALGSRRLGQLQPEEIKQWLNDELVSGLASSSVHRHYRTLRRMLQSAVEKDRLLANPCDRVHPPKVTTRKMAVLDWKQASPWPKPTPTDIAHSSTSRSTPGCAGASSPACAVTASMSFGARCA